MRRLVVVGSLSRDAEERRRGVLAARVAAPVAPLRLDQRGSRSEYRVGDVGARRRSKNAPSTLAAALIARVASVSSGSSISSSSDSGLLMNDAMLSGLIIAWRRSIRSPWAAADSRTASTSSARSASPVPGWESTSDATNSRARAKT